MLLSCLFVCLLFLLLLLFSFFVCGVLIQKVKEKKNIDFPFYLLSSGILISLGSRTTPSRSAQVQSQNWRSGSDSGSERTGRHLVAGTSADAGTWIWPSSRSPCAWAASRTRLGSPQWPFSNSVRMFNSMFLSLVFFWPERAPATTANETGQERECQRKRSPVQVA